MMCIYYDKRRGGCIGRQIIKFGVSIKQILAGA
jgi:hypothetical protein